LTKELKGQDDHLISLFDWLQENKGFHASEVSERQNCRMPNDNESSLLNISRNQLVIEMGRWIWVAMKKAMKNTF
jgi:DNA-binding GntR family transcriptional regulator